MRYEDFNIHCLTIAKKQLMYAVQGSRQTSNNSKIKCREQRRAGPIIYIKSNGHKIFIHSEFHGVRGLTKISQQIELISMKFSLVLQ